MSEKRQVCWTSEKKGKAKKSHRLQVLPKIHYREVVVVVVVVVKYHQQCLEAMLIGEEQTTPANSDLMHQHCWHLIEAPETPCTAEDPPAATGGKKFEPE